MNFEIIENILHYYTDLLREKSYEEIGKSLHNVIRTMRLSRHDKVCGENFSRLDFGNIPLNEIYFSKNGEYASSFEGCLMREANFMSGHSGAINDVAYSPDGKYVLTGSDDHTAIIWDVETGLMMHRLVGHKVTIVAVSFLSDEKTCLTFSRDYTITLWDLATGKITHASTFHIDTLDAAIYGRWFGGNAVAFSSDGKTCLIKSWTDSHTAILWDVATGKSLHDKPLTGHTEEITSVAFSADGKICLTGSRDCTAILWNIEKRKPLYSPLKGATSKIVNTSISGNGKICLTSSMDGITILWDIEKYKRIWETKEEIIGRTAFSHNGKILLSQSQKTNILTRSLETYIAIWELETYKVLYYLKLDHDTLITSLFFSQDGKICLAGLSDNTVLLWDLNRDNILFLKGHSDIITKVCLSFDGKTGLTGSIDNTAILWDLDTGKPLHELLREHKHQIFDVAISPDGKNCLTASQDETAILWNVETGKPVHELKGHDFGTLSVVFSPDGKTCLSSGVDGEVCLWNVKDGTQLWQYRASSYANSLIQSWMPAESFIAILDYSSDSKTCIIGTTDGTINIRNIKPGGKIYPSIKEDGYFKGNISYASDLCKVLIPTISGKAYLKNPFTGETLDTLYHISNIHFNGCNCKDIIAEDLVKKILYQYNADI